MIIETPGLYKGISNEDYHRSPGISNSGIRLILDCPKIYYYRYLSGEYERKESADKKIGTAVHTLVLEPDTFFDRYLIVDAMPTKPNRRSTYETRRKYEDFITSAGGREILTEDDYLQAGLMANNIINHAAFKKVKGTGCFEDSIMWLDPDSGAPLRTRPDFYNDFLIIDIKTAKDVRRAAFARHIYEYGYHSQAAMACDGLTAATGIPYNMVVLFAVAKEPPYLVQPYVLKGQALEQGRADYKKGAAIYQQCLITNTWPGYEEAILDIDLPAYAYRSNDNE